MPVPAAPPRRLLLLLLLHALLRGALPGTGSNAAEKPPRQVNGRLGGPAQFPLKLSPTKPGPKIEWSFQASSGPEFQIAELRDGKLERQNTSGSLGQRLGMADETTLRIRALEKEDSGVFTARVIFPNSVIAEQAFCLSVLEPVPAPRIYHQLVSKTAEGCNVTLQCLASNKEGFSVSWKRGNQLSDLEGGSGWYRLYAEGTELQLFWRPDSSDSTVTCLLSNPVDQKNASFDLLSICPREGHPRTAWLLLLFLLVPVLAVVLGVYLWKKRFFSPCIQEGHLRLEWNVSNGQVISRQLDTSALAQASGEGIGACGVQKYLKTAIMSLLSLLFLRINRPNSFSLSS